MNSNYYYLAASLPLIELGSPLPFRFQMLRHFLRENLTSTDMQKVGTIRLYYDIKNMRSLWTNGPLLPYGNLNPSELEEAITSKSLLPEYVIDFLIRHPETSERLAAFALLIKEYYEKESEKAEGFLKKYLIFERGWRLILAAFRARSQGRDLLKEFQYENMQDPIVMQLLLLKESKTFEPPTEFTALKPLYEMYGSTPLELHQALCEFRFRTIEELVELDTFSIDRICAFLVQFIIAERYLDLDRHKGIKFIDSFTKEAS